MREDMRTQSGLEGKFNGVIQLEQTLTTTGRLETRITSFSYKS